MSTVMLPYILEYYYALCSLHIYAILLIVELKVIFLHYHAAVLVSGYSVHVTLMKN
jgi:hypothetical protein